MAKTMTSVTLTQMIINIFFYTGIKNKRINKTTKNLTKKNYNKKMK